MKRVKYLLTLIALIIGQLTVAQYYTTGSDPAYIKWKQINSQRFKVVFPYKFESEAKRLLSMLDSLHAYGGYSLDHNPRRIPVLIHSETAYSNGLVSWAPKRMELYPTPDQNVFSQDYLEQLALHEFRHVAQIDKINIGFTHLLSFPFGEQAIGGILGLYVPLWFLEGDAVVTETTLSSSGRGRVPNFEQETRAHVLEKRTYPYEKAYFGSYKDYIPNHYRMGYLFVAGARYKYGSEVWEKALNETGQYSWSITPFNRGIKKVTGKNKVPLYKEVYSDWQQRWSAFDDSIKLTSSRYITKRNPRYKNYEYPVAIDNDHIIAEVSGPDEVRHFAKINTRTGETKKLLTIGYRNYEPFSFGKNKICWTELKQHPRWENQYFSIIRTYDIVTKKQKRITSKSRYYSPAISNDGKTIATVYVSTDNKREIHLLDAEDGQLIKVFKTPNNVLPLTPSWKKDSNELVMVLLTQQGKRISLLNTSTGNWVNITQPTTAEIVSPQFIGNRIYFSASWSGIDNIYRIDLDGSKLEKMTESRFGATQVSASANSNAFIYQDYTSDGYQIASVNINDLQPSYYQPQALPIEPFIQQLTSQEKDIPNLKDLPTDDYESKKYSKWNIFNFHSWAPININLDDEIVTPGISLMSQNLLGTTITTMGYNADSQYSDEKFYFNLTHRAWWPVFELKVKAGDTKYYDQNYYISDIDTFKLDLNDLQNNVYADLEVNVPLNFTKGRWSRWVLPSVSVGYQYNSSISYLRTSITKEHNQIIEKETITVTQPELHARPVSYGLLLYNISNRSERDITSRWGQLLELNYRHTPIGGIDLGEILAVHSRLYIPGILRHHSIRIDNDWQQKSRGEMYYNDDTRLYYRYFSNMVDLPRGYGNVDNDWMYSFKGDYMFPLISPDLNIPGVMYLKRITSNLFYDYSETRMHVQLANTGEWLTQRHTFESIGAELRAELHPFRFVYPMTIGYRYAYHPQTKNNYSEVMIGIGFSNFTVGH